MALDTSALSKRYVEEPGTPQVLALCAQADEVILSELCVPEIISALNRCRREGRLSNDAYDSIKLELAGDLSQATIVPLTPDLMTRTIHVLEICTLRALDAIHVATAIESKCDLFATADIQQSKAAKQLGLNGENV
jgi:predicted nucleic acid-binding protein